MAASSTGGPGTSCHSPSLLRPLLFTIIGHLQRLLALILHLRLDSLTEQNSDTRRDLTPVGCVLESKWSRILTTQSSRTTA
jgi:hypothetical protein